MARDVSTLINLLEQDGGIPESSARFSRADLVAMFNKSMEQQVLPDLFQLNEEYLLTKKTFAFKTGSTLNFPTGFVPVPPRSYGQTVRAISYQSPNETEAHYMLPYIEVREEPVFNRKSYQATSTFPRGWHFRSNGMQILGNHDIIDGTLHVQFYLSPSVIVDSTTLQITIVNIIFTGTQLVLVAPTAAVSAGTFSAGIANTTTSLLDVIHTPTGTVQLWGKSAIRTDGVSWDTTGAGAYSKFVFTVDSELTANYSVELATMFSAGLPMTEANAARPGDLALTLANQTSITNLPQEWDNLLMLDVAKRIWSSLGDMDKAAQYSAMYSETHKKLTSAFGVRSKGEPKVISNRRGLMEGLRAAQWWGRRAP